MSLFVGNGRPFELPMAPGNSIWLRPLRGREADEAKAAQSVRLMTGMKFTTEQVASAQAATQFSRVKPDPKLSFDRDVWLRYAITRWEGQEFADKELSWEAIDDLDAGVRDWAFDLSFSMVYRSSGEEDSSSL